MLNLIMMGVLMQAQTNKQTPARSPWRKPRADQHSERLVTLLTREDYDRLVREADGEPLGAISRRILRDYLKHQRGAQG
jgi:hypothetical protein